MTSTCPHCGRSFRFWNRYQVAGHLSRHSPLAHHLTPEERLQGARKGFRVFAQRYAGGDPQKAKKILTEMGRFAADPVPENGAFRLSSDVPTALRETLTAKRIYA